MKTFLFTLVFLCGTLFAGFAQPRVSILGDSYSAFENTLTPATNLTWYTTTGRASQLNDVRSVEQMWWHQLIARMGGRLEVNNSYSGATICHTGREGGDYSDRSYVSRMHALGNPDILFVFGGTNDSWIEVPIGREKEGKYTRKELFSFRPAFDYLLRRLRELYPDTRIYNITNSELSDEVTEAMEEICRAHGIPNIRLHDIDKIHSHPSVAGMKAISEQVFDAVAQ